MAITWSAMTGVFEAETGIHRSTDIAASTDVRDVSEILDAMYLAETPILNRCGFGKPSTNRKIEWLTENLGYFYVVASNGGAIATGASAIIFGTSDHGAISTAMRQIHTGTLLMAINSGVTGAETGSVAYFVIEVTTITGSTDGQWLSGAKASIADATTFIIVGSPVNEGSEPRWDSTRPRGLASNVMQILRQDIQITGTAQSTELYGVSSELTHQLKLHTMEARRELERTLMYGFKEARSATEPGLMGGIFDYLRQETGSHIDNTTASITPSTLNDALAAMWDKGGFDTDAQQGAYAAPFIAAGSKQIRTISQWETDKVRMAPDNYIVGQYSGRLMSDLGIVFELVPTRWARTSDLFIINPAKIKVRPMANRMWNWTRLGLKGDYEQHQLIGEFAAEMKGTSLYCHGLFRNLT